MQCHSTTLPGYMDVPDHAAALDWVREGSLSCASAGCHGPAHFSKPDEVEPAEANAP
jgi:cytochrome c-type protein NapC